jgi:O-antigen ligase
LEYDNPNDAGTGTHNGYVDLLLMGGIPLCAVYLMLFSRAGWKLWRTRRRAGEHMKDVAALALCFYLLFVTAVLLGDAFGKLSWWLLGCALQAVSMLALGVGETTTATADRFEPGGVPSR